MEVLIVFNNFQLKKSYTGTCPCYLNRWNPFVNDSFCLPARMYFNKYPLPLNIISSQYWYFVVDNLIAVNVSSLYLSMLPTEQWHGNNFTNFKSAEKRNPPILHRITTFQFDIVKLQEDWTVFWLDKLINITLPTTHQDEQGAWDTWTSD